MTLEKKRLIPFKSVFVDQLLISWIHTFRCCLQLQPKQPPCRNLMFLGWTNQLGEFIYYVLYIQQPESLERAMISWVLVSVVCVCYISLATDGTVVAFSKIKITRDFCGTEQAGLDISYKCEVHKKCVITASINHPRNYL